MRLLSLSGTTGRSLRHLAGSITSPAISRAGHTRVYNSAVINRPFHTTNNPDDPSANTIYHAGLRYTQFTNKVELTSESPVIPIFRMLNLDGNLESDWELPMTLEEIKENYYFMVRVSIWDSMLYNIQRQGRISFYIQNDGEEALQTGVGAALHIDDNLWCQYRELGVLMHRGFTLDDVLDQVYSTKGDPGKGRQMPISYTKRSIGLHTVCTPLTTQLPHAAGCGYAFRNARESRVSVAFFGEGAASEGDFHAALNFAAVLKSQTLFMCRNNGYAISTPVTSQYAGDGIAIRGLAYGMQTVRVDGNDFLASYVATKIARQHCVEKREPVCLEFMTYRSGHHSTSDESSQYRPPGELESWSQPGVRPLTRVQFLLKNHGMFDEAEDAEVRKQAKKLMLSKLKEAEQRKRVPLVPGIFDDVYEKREWHIESQAEQFRQFMKKYGDKYDTKSYDPER